MERLDKESAVACSLNDEEFRERRALARRTLIPKIANCERIQNAVVFNFSRSSGLRQNIEDFVTLEQGCCGFLTFEIIDDGSDQPATLRISGPPEASATLDIFANTVNAE